MKHVIIIHDNNNADSYCSASIKGNLPYSNVSYDAHNLLILRGNNITINASKNKVTGLRKQLFICVRHLRAKYKEMPNAYCILI